MAITQYAEKFESQLQEKYQAKSYSEFLTTPAERVRFLDAKTIKVPTLSLGGYGAHNRKALGFNSSELETSYKSFELTWDRDVEIFIDPMDVDESNQVASIANIQNQFEDQVAIPEQDKYRFSKIYKDFKATGGVVDTDAPTAANILKKFDKAMEAMDEAEVPAEGRRLVCTPAIATMLKQAEGIQRTLEVSAGKKAVNRNVYSLDDVELVKVPSVRLKTAYEDTGEGATKVYVPTHDAKQIYFMLIEPSAVIAVNKYAYIQTFSPGHDSRGADKWIYQNRKYGDLFVNDNKKAGIAICAENEAA